jgi:DNA-binding transcriptional LysR family regulator
MNPATARSLRAGLPIHRGSFASQSYIKRRGRPHRWEDLDKHAIIEFAGELADNHAARWLRTVAPRATIAIRGNSMLGVLAAVKSGAGLAPLPMLLGRSEDELELVLESIPEIDSKLYLRIGSSCLSRDVTGRRVNLPVQ